MESLVHAAPAAARAGALDPIGTTTIDGVWSAIGDTPLVRLTRLFPAFTGSLHAKLEFLNPAGSSKDRAAFQMVRCAVQSGRLAPGGVVIESSSGNMGIALAQACKYYGLRLICVVDQRTTDVNRRVLEAYGADVDVVTDTSDPLRARIARVEEYLAVTPGAFWTNQYVNEDNPGAHCDTTAVEIVRALGRAPDVLLCPVSTCGTISGLDQGLSRLGGETILYAVDLVGSALFSDTIGPRYIPGIGSSRQRHFAISSRVKAIHVSDRECVAGCRRLLDREAIFAGGSSGAVIAAAGRIIDDLAPDATVVLVLADRGERYLDTIYSDDWVRHLPDRPPSADEAPR